MKWRKQTRPQKKARYNTILYGVSAQKPYAKWQEQSTRPSRIKWHQRINPVIQQYFLPKRKTYHNRGEFFWTKHAESETPEDFWRRLIEIEKECNFENITAEEFLISKFMTAITDKKLRDKLMKEKTRDEKSNRNDQTEHIRSNKTQYRKHWYQTEKKKSKKNQYKEWTNSTHDREINSTRTDHADFAMHQTGAKLTNAQHWTRHAITAERRAILYGHADKKKITNANSQCNRDWKLNNWWRKRRIRIEYL